MQERTEEERASRAPLPVMVDGKRHELRILKRSESRVWKRTVAERTGAMVAEDVSAEVLLAHGGLAGFTDELLADLVLAYDVEGVLGGAETLEDMTDQELLDAYRAMVKVTFPFGSALEELMTTFGTNVLSPSPSSTNGRSRTGRDSGRKGSTPSLTSS